MNIGILGAGNIAEVMANTINGMEDVNLYAVASRTYEKAAVFAQKHGAARAYGSYEELAEDDSVDLIYIATPHSHHFQHMKLCIEHGRNVLCEKAFTENSSQAEEIIAMAKEKKVYLAEAIWTRYMPSRHMINELIESDIIGKIKTLNCNLSYSIADKERIIRPELAGGALLDLGVYGINFVIMHFGKDFIGPEASVVMTETGVDGQETIIFKYPDGKLAVSTHSIYGRSDRRGIFYGEKGYIEVDNINNPHTIKVYDCGDALIKQLNVPAQITGYEYEIRESLDMIRRGKKESESMPLSETLYVMELMDKLRKSWL
ncbi:MAG: Gfo/Idh/MocA family oxidoreductase [Clostridiales bacterium]|nr:Gfo/Idh/MocA family oxidoreductase [Clostridiales bacterium]